MTTAQPVLFDLDDGPPGALAVQRVSIETANRPCEQWHYSGIPYGLATDVYGVWEDRRFAGVIVFGVPVAKHAHRLLEGVMRKDCKELVRIALRDHQRPVTQMLSQAVDLFRGDNGHTVRLLITYADMAEGHVGTIYQAANWIYVGQAAFKDYYIMHGEKVHPRTMVRRYGSRNMEVLRKIDPGVQHLYGQPKHKYALAFGQKWKKRLRRLAKPYPKP